MLCCSKISIPEPETGIDVMGAETVQKVCTKYVYDKHSTIAAVGSIEQGFNWIHSNVCWFCD